MNINQSPYARYCTASWCTIVYQIIIAHCNVLILIVYTMLRLMFYSVFLRGKLGTKSRVDSRQAVTVWSNHLCGSPCICLPFPDCHRSQQIYMAVTPTETPITLSVVYDWYQCGVVLSSTTTTVLWREGCWFCLPPSLLGRCWIGSMHSPSVVLVQEGCSIVFVLSSRFTIYTPTPV